MIRRVCCNHFLVVGGIDTILALLWHISWQSAGSVSDLKHFCRRRSYLEFIAPKTNRNFDQQQKNVWNVARVRFSH